MKKKNINFDQTSYIYIWDQIKIFKKIWDSVWEEDLSEIEAQRKYFAKLDKELKGADRFHLIAVRRKIDELEMKIPFSNLLTKRSETLHSGNRSIELKDTGIEGDGTEWIVDKNKEGKLFIRAMGSNEKLFQKINKDKNGIKK